jgi:hypothetical protein
MLKKTGVFCFSTNNLRKGKQLIFSTKIPKRNIFVVKKKLAVNTK